LSEGSENFTVSIDYIEDSNFEDIQPDHGNDSVTTTILDETNPYNPTNPEEPNAKDPALISITGPSEVVEGDVTDPYIVAVDQLPENVTTPITVQLLYTGTAVDGTDFTGVAEVTIPAGIRQLLTSVRSMICLRRGRRTSRLRSVISPIAILKMYRAILPQTVLQQRSWMKQHHTILKTLMIRTIRMIPIP